MNDKPVDLRSDTLTRPTPAMRRAMAEAEVGDDVFGEDPTVRRLEEEAAGLLGKEAALFVPSGTMGNQIALHVHTKPGCEVICEAESHVVKYEMGAMAVLSGLQPKILTGKDGALDPLEVEAAVNPAASTGDPYRPTTGLLALENTHNMAGGRVVPLERISLLSAVARRHRLPVHLDGARIFNAATVLDVSVERLAAEADTVMFCLSKGLGAPVGSMLCGAKELIEEALRVRRMLGGAMRQVGVLAAAGLVALAEGPKRLAQDHRRARRLAECLAQLPWAEIDPETVETNIVIFRVRRPESAPAMTLVDELAELGVLAAPTTRQHIRFVTHRDLSEGDIERAEASLRTIS